MGNTNSGQGEKRGGGGGGGVEGGERVLPGGARPRLRATPNGAILQAGGTISLRSSVQSDRSKGVNKGKYGQIDRKLYGSEPDLRITEQKEHSSFDGQAKFKFSRSRKKYKAPPAPQNTQGESSSPDSYQHWEKNKHYDLQPSRRLRLFRTRAEAKRRPQPPPLHRSHSTPHIEADPSSGMNDMGNLDFLQSGGLGHQIVCSRSDLQPKTQDIYKEALQYKQNITKRPVRRDSDEENKTWQRISPVRSSAPVKTFYFGMNSEGDGNDTVLIEKFAEKLQHISLGSTSNNLPYTSSSESLADMAPDEDGRGIKVQLRATLPRKQVDIPRFSPTTAWRLLSALESPLQSEDDDLVPMEDRIPAPPLPLHIPSHMDKSADSGISGDASPHHHDSTHNSQAAWTPQQDLEETSSEGGLDSIPVSPESLTTAKFSPRFSLSLPRDNRLKLYTQNDKVEISHPASLHSLKKLKRSMSGVLGKGSFLKEENTNIAETQQLLDNNWVLSRSVPNSLNITHVTLPKWCETNSPVIDQEENIQQTSFSNFPSFLHLANGGHIMYLPSYTTPRERSVGALAMSKSCEDLSCETIKVTESVIRTGEIAKGKSSRKFTFQSTIRQLERKKIAEKLSKQAEHRERERHSEIEVMRRVEEEFQRKREREKADIRQQLRLYSIKQNERKQFEFVEPAQATQVLSEYRQPQRDYRDYRPQRGISVEPDTASICETSRRRETVHPEVVYKIPKSTQVYITSMQNNTNLPGMDLSGASDNYRKDFAQGALPHSLASSDSEVSQPNSRLVQSRLTAHDNHDSNNHLDDCDFVDSEKGKEDVRNSEGMIRDSSPDPLSTFLVNSDSVLTICSKSDYEEKVMEEKEPSTNTIPCMNLRFIQPFARGRSYRPVPFKPSNNPVAQFAT